jgi:hypothetical protein
LAITIRPSLQAQEAMKLEVLEVGSITPISSTYLLVNRLDEARATAQEAQAHNLDNPLFTSTFTALISCNTMRQEWSVRRLG